MTIQERVTKIIVDQLGAQPNEVTLDASIENDLGADSLDVVELIMKLEDEFSRSIPDEDATELQTVGQIVAYITERVPRKETRAGGKNRPLYRMWAAVAAPKALR